MVVAVSECYVLAEPLCIGRVLCADKALCVGGNDGYSTYSLQTFLEPHRDALYRSDSHQDIQSHINLHHVVHRHSANCIKLYRFCI